MRALLLVLESSGIRVGEALQLTLSDITGKDPAMVSVRAETAKEGHSYFSFLSSEAQEALNEWLNVREDYLKSGIWERNTKRKATKEKAKSKPQMTAPKRPPTGDLVFPFPYTSASRSFNQAVKAAGLYEQDRRTKRTSLHLHLLRKYFSSQMKKNVPPEVVETFLGHRGYLGGVYNNQLKQEDYVAAYQKGIGQLLIFEDVAKLQAVSAELGEKSTQFSQVAAYNQALIQKNQELMAEMEKWFKLAAQQSSAVKDAATVADFNATVAAPESDPQALKSAKKDLTAALTEHRGA